MRFFGGAFAVMVAACLAYVPGVSAQGTLPPLTVETSKPKAASKKKATTKQPTAATQSKTPVATSDSALKSPPDSFVAKDSMAGTKTATSLLESPLSLSVITLEQLKARDAKTLTEALQYVPGVYTQPGGADPRYDWLTIRGFNSQNNDTYRDGLKELGSADGFAHFRTELWGVERIDVLRGPSSVLYGQIAPGGLVNVTSKRPTEESIRDVQGKIGSNGLFEGAFDLAGKVDPSGQLLFRMIGLVRDSDAQLAHISDFVPDDRVFFAPSLTWRPDANTSLTVLADIQHDNSGNAFLVPLKTAAGSITALPLYLGDPDYNKFVQDQFRVGYQFEHRFNDVFTFRQGLRYGEVDIDYRYLTVAGLASVLTEGGALKDQQRVAFAVGEHTSSFTVDTQLETKIATGPVRHTILTGIDYQRFMLDGRTMLGLAPSLNIDNPVYGQPVAAPTTATQSLEQEASQLGVYVQDQAKLGSWVLTYGGRYDWASLDSLNRLTDAQTNSDDEAFTGRVGLAYVFSSGLAPYVSYATSFMPTTGTDKNGAPFVPTTGEQYEAGIKFEPAGKRTRLTLSVFDLTQQNVLTPDPTVDPTLGKKIQTGEVRSRGFEAEWVANPFAGLQLIATYTKFDMDVTKSTTLAEIGKTPTLTPEEMASIFADYTFQDGPLKGFGFGAGVRYVGPTFMDTGNVFTNDAYTVFDAALHYTVGNATYSLNASNLFNEDTLSCTTTGGCQYIAPLIVTGTVRYRW